MFALRAVCSARSLARAVAARENGGLVVGVVEHVVLGVIRRLDFEALF